MVSHSKEDSFSPISSISEKPTAAGVSKGTLYTDSKSPTTTDSGQASLDAKPICTQQHHDLITDDGSKYELPVEPTKGLWRFVPFQYMSLKPKVINPYVTTAIACMGGMLFGFGSTNVTPFIGKEQYSKYFGQFSAIEQSAMTASMPGGAFLGSIISTFVSDHVGRRGMVQFSGLIWVIGSAIQTACNNRASLAMGRIIASIGIGTASSNVPMYLAEMVPAKTRGRFMACFQLSINIGMLVMYYIGFGCSFIKSPAGFRITWGIQMIPGTIMFVGALFLHESPRWLASKGRWDEVVEVLTALNKCDLENPIVKREVESFQAELEIKQGNLLDLFRKANWKQTMCAAIAMFIQQYCGCNAILYFSTGVTSQIGYKGVMNDIMGSIDYIILLVSTIPAVLFFDRFSRRHTMMFGALGLLTSLSIVAGLQATYGVPVGPGGLNGDPSVRWNMPDPHSAKAALAFSYIYLCIFSVSWGPMGWVYIGEIFNQDVRAVGNAFASIVNWLFNFSLTVYTQIAFEKIVWKTYIIFAVFAFLGFPLVFFLFPETCGYELEQITQIFKSNVPAFKTDPLYIWCAKKIFNKEPKLPEAPPVSESKKPPSTEHKDNIITIE